MCGNALVVLFGILGTPTTTAQAAAELAASRVGFPPRIAEDRSEEELIESLALLEEEYQHGETAQGTQSLPPARAQRAPQRGRGRRQARARGQAPPPPQPPAPPAAVAAAAPPIVAPPRAAQQAAAAAAAGLVTATAGLQTPGGLSGQQELQVAVASAAIATGASPEMVKSLLDTLSATTSQQQRSPSVSAGQVGPPTDAPHSAAAAAAAAGLPGGEGLHPREQEGEHAQGSAGSAHSGAGESAAPAPGGQQQQEQVQQAAAAAGSDVVHIAGRQFPYGALLHRMERYVPDRAVRRALLDAVVGWQLEAASGRLASPLLLKSAQVSPDIRNMQHVLQCLLLFPCCCALLVLACMRMLELQCWLQSCSCTSICSAVYSAVCSAGCSSSGCSACCSAGFSDNCSGGQLSRSRCWLSQRQLQCCWLQCWLQLLQCWLQRW